MRVFDLTGLTTLKLPLQARQVLRISSVENACLNGPEIASQPALIVGGGSNLVVFDSVFDGIVVRPEIKTFDAEIKGDLVRLHVGAGIPWHDLVMKTLKHGWFGLENLALIPGWTGAAPVQNIGAYGVEFAERCESVLLYDFEAQTLARFSRDDMEFGYRHSILKAHPGRFLVLSVTLNLSLKPEPRVEYGAIQDALHQGGGSTDSPQDIADAVMRIRRAKLPDPDIAPNVGSFFKNPVVRPEVADRLAAQFPELPMYPSGDNQKLAAGWMIDYLGFKGRSVGGFSVHDQQALVIVNRNQGTVDELRDLIAEIRQSVKETFGLTLHIEPTQLGRPDCV
jgi:UDP-N-acetylmuramate dehydrogenase